MPPGTYHAFMSTNSYLTDSGNSTLERIREASIDLEDLINTQAKDLLRRLLQRDPLKRPTCEQVMKHPWIAFHHLNRIPLAA